MSANKSIQLYKRATAKIPGGVNSPVRAWKAVGGFPKFIARGKNAYVIDADGKKYLDFVASWGPLVLGHVHPKIVAAVKKAASAGTTFGAPTEQEVKLAELVARLIPSIQELRLVSSGTEAAMSAIRVARAFTQKTKIIKFEGCYHGHSDGLLAKAGSGVATLGLPDSAGVPSSFAQETIVLPYNNLAAVTAAFDQHAKEIAAVIVEPVCGNMGVIPPSSGFLTGLRKITTAHRALLIFDEVITGFRVALGGAQGLYRIKPDLTCLGKILGGGLPLAAFGGKREIMNLLAPIGPVYQAGTLSGNPLAVSAGLATINLLCRDGVYDKLEDLSKTLASGLQSILQKRRISAVVNRVGSMLTLFFGVDGVSNAAEAQRCDREKFARYFHGMLRRGIYLPPSPFEAAFVSLAHTKADLNKTLAAFDDWTGEESDS